MMQNTLKRKIDSKGEENAPLTEQLKEKIDEIAPKAFVIVGDAREVHGEGFIER